MKEKLKKSVKPILSLVLVFALVFTGIFAYLTAKDSATNTFTIGNVDILLYEDDWYDHDSYADTGTKTILNDENENDIPDFAENIVPGQKIAKAPYVENTGRNEAWVYLVVSIPTATESQVLSDDTGSYGINTTQNINVTAYAIQDGYGEQSTLETVSWKDENSDSYTPYRVRAANINGDVRINESDTAVITKVMNNEATINQTTGRP